MDQTTRSKEKITAEINALIEKIGQLKNELTAHDALPQKNSDSGSVEKKLADSAGNYRLFFQNSTIPMWVYDRDDFHITAVNEAAILHYGYSETEFLSMTLFDLRSEKEKEKLAGHKDRLELSSTPISQGTWQHRKKDGTVISVEV